MSFPRLRAVLTTIAAAAALLAPAVAAHADPPAPCRAAGCVGRDPSTSNASGSCSSQTILARVTPPGGGPTIDLKWSDWCVANWARFEDTDLYSPSNWNYWVETRDGRRLGQINGNHLWTAMADGSQQARACIRDYGPGGPPVATPFACTGWF